MLHLALVLNFSLAAYCAAAGPIGWSLRHPWWYYEPSESTNAVRITAQQDSWQVRQRFLLDVLLQVHKPLLQRELVKLGSELNKESSFYQEGSAPLLEDFMRRVEQGRMLGPYSIYNQLATDMTQQLLGVYRFFLLAKNWTVFQQNVCYARNHFNAVLFVNALQLALPKRQDTQDLILPAMHEVLPQLFYDARVIKAAQRVNWQELDPTVSHKTGWRQLLQRFVSPKSYWRPVVPVSNDEIVIPVEQDSGIVMDLSLNSYWNRLLNTQLITMAAATEESPVAVDNVEEDEAEGPNWNIGKRLRRNDNVIIEGDRMMAFRGASDELAFRLQLMEERKSPVRSKRLIASPLQNSSSNLAFLQQLQQLAARLQLESLVRGNTMDVLPQLLTTGGVPYKLDPVDSNVIGEILKKSLKELKSDITTQLQQQQLSVGSPEAMNVIGEVLQLRYYQMHKEISTAFNEVTEQPTMLSTATSNLKDPIYKAMLLELMHVVNGYEHKVQFQTAANADELIVAQVVVGPLQTYDELLDTDLINLMDQQLLLTRGNYLQLLQRRLVARQLRLNHKPFNISYELQAKQTTQVLIQSFLILHETKQPTKHILLDSFVQQLTTGRNVFERSSLDINWTGGDAPTMSELYEATSPKVEDTRGSACGWPHRLLLPRGIEDGLLLKLLVLVAAMPNNLYSKGSGMLNMCEGFPFVGEFETSALVDVVIKHKARIY